MASPKGVLVGHCRSQGLYNAVLESWPVATIDRPDCSRNAGTERCASNAPLDPLVCPTAGRLCRWRGPTFPPATKPSKNFLALAFSVDFNLLQQSAEPNKT